MNQANEFFYTMFAWTGIVFWGLIGIGLCFLIAGTLRFFALEKWKKRIAKLNTKKELEQIIIEAETRLKLLGHKK